MAPKPAETKTSKRPRNLAQLSERELIALLADGALTDDELRSLQDEIPPAPPTPAR